MANLGGKKMGEISEMILDGTLCEQCGEYIGDEVGFPRSCYSCGGEGKEEEEPIWEKEEE